MVRQSRWILHQPTVQCFSTQIPWHYMLTYVILTMVKNTLFLTPKCILLFPLTNDAIIQNLFGFIYKLFLWYLLAQHLVCLSMFAYCTSVSHLVILYHLFKNKSELYLCSESWMVQCNRTPQEKSKCHWTQGMRCWCCRSFHSSFIVWARWALSSAESLRWTPCSGYYSKICLLSTSLLLVLPDSA